MSARRITSALGLAVVVALLVSACAPAPQATAVPPTPTVKSINTQVTFATASEPITLDPDEQKDTPTNIVTGNMFDGLIDKERDGKVVPALALSWKRLDDLTWEFKLRPGVKFHNGEDFTADAVKFSFERTAHPDFKTGWRSYVRLLKSVEVLDPLTVRIRTTEPYPVFLSQAAVLPIVPPKYVQEKGVDYFKKNPVGTGPFKFVEWLPGTRIVMEANEQYWAGAPKVKRYVVRPIPELSTRIAELETGGVDMITHVAPDQIGRIEKNPTLGVVPAEMARVLVLQVNTRSGNPALKDKRVREAISLAIDRKLIIDKLLLGYAAISNSQVGTPSYHGYNPDLKAPVFDPARAKQLLQEAGKVGLELTYHTPTGRYVMDKEISEVIGAQLNDVGFKVKVVPLETGRWVQMLQTREIGDLTYVAVGADDLDIGYGLSNYFTSKSTWSQYDNPDLDKVVNPAIVIMDDDLRAAALRKASAYAAEDFSGIFLYHMKYLYAANKRLKWDPRPGDWRGVRAYDVSFAQ